MGNRTAAIGCVTAAILAVSAVPVIPLELHCLPETAEFSCMATDGEPTVEDVIRLMMYGDDPMVIKAIINTIAGPDEGPDVPMIIASR